MLSIRLKKNCKKNLSVHTFMDSNWSFLVFRPFFFFPFCGPHLKTGAVFHLSNKSCQNYLPGEMIELRLPTTKKI
jgi:hypothetical protein